MSGRREDGYHNLETVFYPIPFYDALEIIEDSSFSFSATGIYCGNAEDNLCVRAFQLLQKDFPHLTEIRAHLHKAIPAGAGLGGGSADGTFMLKMVDEKFSLNIHKESLSVYALQLGSDCPFFLYNKPCLASGRGEQLSEISISLKDYQLLLVMPGIHLSTSSIFQKIETSQSKASITEAILHPVDAWRFTLKNEFEPVVFQMHPELGEIKALLYQTGAVYAAMTGTGSCIYGIYKEKTTLPEDFHYAHKWLAL